MRLLPIWGRGSSRLKISARVIVNAGAIYSLNQFKSVPFKTQDTGRGVMGKEEIYF